MSLKLELQGVVEFAKASERINDFARLMRERGINAVTGADIRCYENGAKLEKWIEVENVDASSTFCWWLEMACIDEGAIISASASESHGGDYKEIEGFHAANIIELTEGLDLAVLWLKNQDFR